MNVEHGGLRDASQLCLDGHVVGSGHDVRREVEVNGCGSTGDGHVWRGADDRGGVTCGDGLRASGASGGHGDGSGYVIATNYGVGGDGQTAKVRSWLEGNEGAALKFRPGSTDRTPQGDLSRT